MQDVNQVTKEVNKLLWSGKPDAARSIITEHRDKIMHELGALQKALEQIDILSPPDATDEQQDSDQSISDKHEDSKKPASATLDSDVLGQRRQTVLSTALQLSKESTSGFIKSRAVADRLFRDGHEMHVPSNRVNTAISNILSRDDRFEKQDVGIYKIMTNG